MGNYFSTTEVLPTDIHVSPVTPVTTVTTVTTVSTATEATEATEVATKTYVIPDPITDLVTELALDTVCTKVEVVPVEIDKKTDVVKKIKQRKKKHTECNCGKCEICKNKQLKK